MIIFGMFMSPLDRMSDAVAMVLKATAVQVVAVVKVAARIVTASIDEVAWFIAASVVVATVNEEHVAVVIGRNHTPVSDADTDANGSADPNAAGRDHAG